VDQKDSLIEEILKRLKSIDYRLNSIEEFLKGEQEERIPEEKEKRVAHLVKEEPEEIENEREIFTPEARKETVRTEKTPVSSADQEKIWINVLHKIGIVALIIGVGLFIKYSFPYIGLWGRIAIGLLIGTGLLYVGERLMKEYGTYALGISSCGIVILYFSFYAAAAFYNLVHPAVAFFMMVLVTIVGVLLSLRYDSSVISFIAVVGAFLTTYVFRGGEITPLALIVLFSYLTLINGWILTVTKIKEWKWLNILAFSLTAMMLLTTIKFSFESGYPWVFLTFSTIFFALFFYIPRKESSESLIVLFLNPFLYYFILWFITYKINPYIAGTLALVLAAFYYYAGSRIKEEKSLDIAWSFTSLAVFFLTVAIPIFFKTNWATCAWAVEGTIILSLGRKEKILKNLSLVLLGIAVFKMLFIDYFILETFSFFFNSIIAIMAVFLCAKFLSGEVGGKMQRVGALNILGMILVFLFITFTGTSKFFEEFDNLIEMKSLVISVLWGLYALVLFVLGITRESSPTKIAGFLVASLTIIKVFFYDLSYLETTYRVLSLVVLGVILLIISFVYQKKMGRKEENE